jgi:hypothetical protein
VERQSTRECCELREEGKAIEITNHKQKNKMIEAMKGYYVLI